ncbi:Gfo/Idh/MocA family protein [Lichenicoccus sp.]|uniref:Gfo/Idh/MocA family protein n=1 Tax=Lichenicoccus sp. TaxID=2781899 RepID=UPI003D0E2814
MKRQLIAIVGLGKIAVDQHVPAILGNPAFELAAIVSQRRATVADLPSFDSLEALFAAMPEVEVVAFCTPPAGRFEATRTALRAGRQVLIEKPPAATLGEITELAAIAERAGRVLFATWHSRFNPAVAEARRRLAGQRISRLRVDWREDVRRWHPGQAWIWQPGGFGVFDPGINALSIVTEIMPEPLFVAAAQLDVPANRQTPIGAEISFATADPAPGTDLSAVFDWRKQGEQSWTIEVATAAGETLTLTEGGARLAVNGTPVIEAGSHEYPMIYERFATLLAEGRSEVDIRPLQLVADAFLVGERRATAPFDD